MFGWEFPPFNSGGLGTACHGLTRALIDASVDVKFVLPRELPYTDDWIDFVFAGHGKVQKDVYKRQDFNLLTYSPNFSTLNT